MYDKFQENFKVHQNLWLIGTERYLYNLCIGTVNIAAFLSGLKGGEMAGRSTRSRAKTKVS